MDYEKVFEYECEPFEEFPLNSIRNALDDFRKRLAIYRSKRAEWAKKTRKEMKNSTLREFPPLPRFPSNDLSNIVNTRDLGKPLEHKVRGCTVYYQVNSSSDLSRAIDQSLALYADTNKKIEIYSKDKDRTVTISFS